MRFGAFVAITALVVFSLLVGCAPTAPTVAPTKPAAAQPAAVPATAATTAPAAAATKPAATAATPAPAAKIKRGGVLRDVVRATFDSFDPQLNSQRNNNPSIELMFDTLLGYKLVDRKKEAFEIIPGLAESYKMVDPTTIEFKLQKGVKAHDGSDFKASDAKWSLERAMTHPKSQVKLTLDGVSGIDTVDDLTLRVKFKAPSSVFPIQMTYANPALVAMLPRTSVEKLGDEKFAFNPVGTGPMKLKEQTRDVRIVLEKFPNHWEKGEDGQPLPYLDGYSAQILPDQTVALVELKAGNVDVFPDLELKDVASLQGSKDLVAEETPSDWVAYPGFYFNPRKGTSFPFSNNQKLRQAAQYAVDHESMAKALGFGLARSAYYPLWMPGMLGYDEALPRRDLDVAKAKALVAEAGFPNGVDVEVKAINRPLDVRPLEVLQSMWGKADIRLKITGLDRLVWISDGETGKFEGLSHQFRSTLDPHLSQSTRTGSGQNWPGYSNPDGDKLWEQAEREYDTNKRADIYKQIQRLIYEDAFHVSGYMYPRMAGLSNKVKNYIGWPFYRYMWLDK